MSSPFLSLSLPDLARAIALRPLTVTSDWLVTDAIALLSDIPLGGDLGRDYCPRCLAVVDGTQLVGLLSDRAVTRWAVSGRSLSGVTVAEVIEPGVMALRQSELTDMGMVLNLLQQQPIQYLPLLADDGQLIGIVTYESLCRVWQSPEFNAQLAEQAAAQAAELRLEAARSQLLMAVSTRIRASLSLTETLDATVNEVRQFLGCDRVSIYHFGENYQFQVVAEALAADRRSFVSEEIYDPCFASAWAEQYGQGRVHVVTDIYTAGMTPCHVELLERLQIRAKILVPVIINNQFWGLVSASESAAPRDWHVDEVKFVEHLSIQVAIAIQQSQTATLLQQQQQNLEMLLDRAPDIIFRLDRDLRYLYLNAAVESTLGYAPAALIGQPALVSTLAPEYLSEWQALTQRVAATQQEETIEYQIRTPHRVLWFQTRVAPELSMNETVTSFLCIARDITQKKQDEVKLQSYINMLLEWQNRHHAAQQATRQVLYERDVAADHVTWGVNADQVFGSDSSEMPQSAAGWYANIHPEDEKWVQTADVDYLEHRGHFCLEYRYRHQDGHYLWVEDQAQFFADANGNLTRIIGYITDISERKRLETERTQLELDLRESEAQLRQIFDNSEDVFFLKALGGGQMIYTSPAWENLYQTPLQQTYDNPQAWLNFIHPEERDRVIELGQQARQGATFSSLEHRIVRPDGSIRWIWNRTFPIRNEVGEIYRIAGINTDITDRKQAELERQRSEALVQAFMAASPVGLSLFDQDLRFIYANEALAKINGLPLSEHLGRTLWDVLPQMASEFAPLLLQVMETQEPALNLEFSGEVSPGVYRSAISNHYPVCLPNGSVIGVGVSVMDVTELAQAQQALRENEERLRLALEASQMETWEWNIRTGQVSQSDKMAAFFSLEPGRKAVASYEMFMARLHPGDRDRVEAEIQRAIVTGEDYETELRFVHPNGTVQWTLDKGKVFYDANGQPVRMSGINLDITARKLAEASLAHLAAIVEHSADAIISKSLNGTILSWNNAAEKIFGYTTEDIVGQPITRLVPSELLHEEQHILETLQQGATVEQYETVRVRQDGRRIHVSVTVSPLKDSTGQIIGASAIKRDITDRVQLEADRKQAEAALRESEELNQRILNSSQDCIKVLTLEGNLLYINAGGLCSLEVDDFSLIANANWLAFWQESDREQAEVAIAAASAGNIGRFSGYCPTLKGNPRWWDVGVTPMRDAAGEVIKLVVISRDITEQKLSEAALRASEQRYRDLAEAMPQMVWLSDATGAVHYFNQRWYDYTGLNEAETMGLGAAGAIHPDERDRTLQQWAEATTTGKIFDIEYRLRHHQGQYRWFIARGLPIHNLAGDITAWVGTITDIDDFKRAVLAQQQSEARFRAVFEQAAVGIVETDLAGQFLRANRRYCQLLGVTETELLKLDYQGVTPFPEDLALNLIYQDQLLAGEIDSFSMEKRMLCSNGELRWCNVTVSPIYTADGTLEFFLGVIQDISARKQAELALQESEAKLNHMLSSAGASIGHFRLYENGVWATEYHSKGCERVFGYRPEDFLAEVWLSGIALEDWHAMQQPMIAAIQAETEITLEYRFYHPDGSTRWISDTVTSCWNEDNRCWAVTAIGTDVSDRKLAELALQQLNYELEARITRRTAALSESETRYRALFEQAAVGISQCYPCGHYIQVNQRFCDLTGYAQAELLKMSWRDLIHPDDLTANQIELARLYQGELASMTVESRYIRKDGQLQWVSVTVSLLYDAAGVLISDLRVVEDIGDRKQIEHRLQTSEKRLREIISKTVDGILILNPQGQILFGNPAAEKIFDCQQPYCQGALLEIPFTLQKTFALDIPYRDGSLHTVEVRVEEITWQDQKAFLAAARDISERQQIQLALQASELSYRTLAENLPGLVYKLYPSQNNEIVFFNDRMKTLLNLGSEGFVNRGTVCPVESLIVSEDRDRVIETIQAAIANQQAFQVEYGIDIPTTQEKRYLLEQGSTVIDNIGQTLHIVGVIFDVTDSKRTEDQLRKINERLTITNAELARATRLKDEFLANMSHELRTPLNSVLGLSEVLQERTYGDLTEQQQRALTTIQTNGQHLLALINDILDLAKIESGKLELQLASISVQQLCRSAIPFIQQQAFRKQINFSLNLASDLLYIEVDERLIRQALINLLINAVKFTPGGGSVTLTVEGNAAEQSLNFSVIDTGIGIAPENIDKLFQPFVQIDSSLSRRYSGTGLGLALVRRIVELHEGSVTACSTVGQGSQFIMSLPWKQANPTKILSGTATAKIDAKSSPMETQNAVEKPIVLLVEDNLDNVETLTAYLDLKGFEIVVARNGLQATQLAQAQSIDLILMDIQMPDMDGLEAIRRIRSQEQNRCVPILAVTALAMPGDKEKCLTAGANDYLSKPISPSYLVSVMKKYLHERL